MSRARELVREHDIGAMVVTTDGEATGSCRRKTWSPNLERTALAILLVVACSLILERPGRTQDPDETSREIMWRKLDLSHNVLDALALEDFEALEAYAVDLEMLGTAGFLFILDTDEYRRRAEDFRIAARALKSAAEEENAEAGALAYMDLTLRCIRCHRSLDVIPR